jgi:methylated-DNA-[protein]-cysteine S-methyltransferase
MSNGVDGNPEISRLLAGDPADRAALERLHRRLEQTADTAGLLDVAYTTVDSPLGRLLLAATERGLVRVAYESEGLDAVLDVLGRRLSPRVLRAPRRLAAAAAELDEYFGRRRTRFDLPLDLSLSAGFRQTVQRYLPRIPYGRTESYQQVAEYVGNPRAVRAVGTACATNPLPIVVPCHRVLRTDGTLGGYVGGLTAKTALLNLEATA